MCGRYSISTEIKVIEKRFKIDVTNYEPRYNAAPGQLLPIITGENPEGFSFFYWGMTPKWSKNGQISQKLINARAETVNAKASFKQAFARRRCLIPADGFYEWKAVGKKTKIPHRITLQGAEPFAFAGIWEEFEDEGENMHTFSIITTEANSLVADIHDRMPVILHPKDEQAWLSNDSNEEALIELLRPYEAEQMVQYSVSPRVNSVANEGPELIKHTPPADQHGNYTLFG